MISQNPKLELSTGARLLVTTYISDRIEPSVVLVLFDTTKSIVALLATAPDHSTSRSASPSSSGLTMPGSVPFRMMFGGLGGRPFIERKVATSLGLRLLRPTIAMVCPVPSRPSFHRAATS